MKNEIESADKSKERHRTQQCNCMNSRLMSTRFRIAVGKATVFKDLLHRGRARRILHIINNERLEQVYEFSYLAGVTTESMRKCESVRKT